jgi:hypothetical protein
VIAAVRFAAPDIVAPTVARLFAALCVLVAPVAAIADAASSAAPPLEFRHDDAGASGQGLMAMMFVAVLAAVAWGLVHYFRQTGRSPIGDRTAGVRIIQMKRLTPKLSVVTVSIDSQRTVVFADNGQALLLLATDSKATAKSSAQEPAT